MVLSTAKRSFVAVGTEEDAGENNFDVPGLDQPPRLLHRVFGRFAEQRRPEFGDDAVGAMRVAPVLDFQVRALPARLMFAQQWEVVGAGS